MNAELVIESLDRRPELAPMLWKLSDVWPPFMTRDPVSDFYYETVERDHPEHTLIAFDPAKPDVPVARAFTVPFEFGTAERSSLPDGGWDTVIRWAALDRSMGRPRTHVSALEIAISLDRRGEGLAAVMLQAMRENVRRLGFTELVAPVRPSGKSQEAQTPMSEYAFRTRDDGLPEDPWLRVHVRAGGELVRVCPRSMVVGGSLAEWREWTGLPFDRTGDVVVPGALVPAHCSVEHDHAVYVEPNVWVRHRLG
ncbi:N-acetyltransferase [Phytoactinopolyspora alkaliphila]|uniref:N-acetyltransferase n=1 Tax=Phytoactinopolyspora alkaliphila TaxID=1783498 RepID=A0A6N9YI25_9ACTN|nr:N-acetyltransferase [Phytoactinopolyspora alkaliphila]NED94602.1 N-acetyltransferase [Phytoactinopolyspora alkaliphila]